MIEIGPHAFLPEARSMFAKPTPYCEELFVVVAAIGRLEMIFHGFVRHGQVDLHH
jgi:hypothetical protein